VKKIYIAIFVCLTMVFGLLPATTVYGSETGTSSGSFQIGNVQPLMTSLELYSDSGLTTVASTIIPQVIYYLKMSLYSPNSLYDIKSLKIKIYADPGGTGIDEDTITTGNAQTAAIYSFNATHFPPSWTLAAGSPTSWTIESAMSSSPSDLTASSGYGVLAFKAGKVATESVSSSDWQIHGQITGSSDLTSGLYSSRKRMMWYGETTVNTANVTWGTVTPGTGFADNINEQDNISVKYAANGDYQELVKSSTTWAGNTNTATFDVAGACVNMKEFSLKAFTSDTYASAVQVNTTGIVVQNTDTQTGEAGNTETTNVLWLKLASTFPVDLYTGTITYIIANR